MERALSLPGQVVPSCSVARARGVRSGSVNSPRFWAGPFSLGQVAASVGAPCSSASAQH